MKRTKEFILDESQIDRYDKWYEKYKKKYGHSTVTFSFTPTGIGTVVEVKRNDNKGKILDLSDVEKW